MYSVEDLFRSLGNGTANDFMVFRKWLLDRISKPSETGQLEWILNSSEITDHAKQLLTEAIARETSVVEDEKDALLKVGHDTITHKDYIEKTRKRIEEQSTKMRTGFFAMAGGFMLIFIVLFANYNGGPKDFGTFMGISMLFFGLTVVCLTQAWNASSEIKEAQEKAIKLENEAIGRDLQIRMTALEQEEERLFGLNKTIVQNGVRNADSNENTSVA